MATKLYDDALIEKIKYWTKDTNLHIYGPDETRRLFQVVADETNDQPIKLPLISISRASSYNIINPNKIPLTFDGKVIDATENRSIQLNAIPIELQYQLDVYTRYYEEADELIRNLIFNIINYPKLLIEIPYENMQMEHDAMIRIASEVNDTSNIPERLISGQFTRFTLSLNIDDAYLWSVKVRDNPKIYIGDVLDEYNNKV